MPSQDPNHAPHLRHAESIAFLETFVPMLEKQAADRPYDGFLASQLDQAKSNLKHTRDRLPLAVKAHALVSQFGFGHEINDKITLNDAANYVAKVLHEVQDGVATSHYQRTHTVRDPFGKKTGELHPHKDPIQGESADDKVAREKRHADHLARMAAPWDPASDVIEHLALSEPAHVAAVKALFATK